MNNFRGVRSEGFSSNNGVSLIYHVSGYLLCTKCYALQHEMYDESYSNMNE